jgi:hypothetical protein
MPVGTVIIGEAVLDRQVALPTMPPTSLVQNWNLNLFALPHY